MPILTLVPGVKWTTSRKLAESAHKNRPKTKQKYQAGKWIAVPVPLSPLPDVPDSQNDEVVILPTAYSDERFSQYVHIKRAKWEKAKGAPIRIYRSPRKHRDFWTYKKKVYVTKDQRLKPEDVVALVNEGENRRRLQLQKAHALQAMTRELVSPLRREAIPQDVKIAVWQRDGGRCVSCSSNENLEFDHIIPLAMGGANTMRNLQLLCEICNRQKGATLG